MQVAQWRTSLNYRREGKPYHGLVVNPIYYVLDAVTVATVVIRR